MRSATVSAVVVAVLLLVAKAHGAALRHVAGAPGDVNQSLADAVVPEATALTGAASWAGTYEVDDSGVNLRICCEFTGAVTVTATGPLTMDLSGSVEGACGYVTSTTVTLYLDDATSNTASFESDGNTFTATRDGTSVTIANDDTSACSASATCTAGACLSSSSPGGGLSTTAIVLIAVGALVVLAFAVMVFRAKRYGNQYAAGGTSRALGKVNLVGYLPFVSLLATGVAIGATWVPDWLQAVNFEAEGHDLAQVSIGPWLLDFCVVGDECVPFPTTSPLITIDAGDFDTVRYLLLAQMLITMFASCGICCCCRGLASNATKARQTGFGFLISTALCVGSLLLFHSAPSTASLATFSVPVTQEATGPTLTLIAAISSAIIGVALCAQGYFASRQPHTVAGGNGASPGAPGYDPYAYRPLPVSAASSSNSTGEAGKRRRRKKKKHERPSNHEMSPVATGGRSHGSAAIRTPAALARVNVETAAAPAVSAPSSSSTFCAFCGAPFPATSEVAFCTKCGKPVAQA